MHIRDNQHELIVLIIGLIFAFVLGSFLIVQKEAASVYSADDDIEKKRIGIVFGAGFTDDGPLEPLQDRLDTAYELYDSGKIQKLLLTGDNRTLDYNEPQVMENYLLERGIPRNAMQQDLAGRSTYESCERAAKIFGVTSAVLISQETHLPRAIYLCEHFGISSIGVKAQGDGSSLRRFVGQTVREVPARAKAVFNAHFIGEDTILEESTPL